MLKRHFLLKKDETRFEISLFIFLPVIKNIIRVLGILLECELVFTSTVTSCSLYFSYREHHLVQRKTRFVKEICVKILE